MFLLKEYIKIIVDSSDSLFIDKESAARRVVLEAAFKVRGERLVQNIGN